MVTPARGNVRTAVAGHLLRAGWVRSERIADDEAERLMRTIETGLRWDLDDDQLTPAHQAILAAAAADQLGRQVDEMAGFLRRLRHVDRDILVWIRDLLTERDALRRAVDEPDTAAAMALQAARRRMTTAGVVWGEGHGPTCPRRNGPAAQPCTCGLDDYASIVSELGRHGGNPGHG